MQFCADFSKKSKTIKAVYIYASGRSRYALSENAIVYYAMTYCFGDNIVWSREILLNFCWVSIFFDILIANISWAVAQTSINHSIFWKSLIGTFRCKYVNCFKKLRVFAEVSTKFWKLQPFGQFTDHNSRRKHENYTNTPFFSSTFSALTVCNIHIFYLKLVKIHFNVVPHLVHSGL